MEVGTSNSMRAEEDPEHRAKSRDGSTSCRNREVGRVGGFPRHDGCKEQDLPAHRAENVPRCLIVKMESGPGDLAGKAAYQVTLTLVVFLSSSAGQFLGLPPKQGLGM